MSVPYADHFRAVRVIREADAAFWTIEPDDGTPHPQQRKRWDALVAHYRAIAKARDNAAWGWMLNLYLDMTARFEPPGRDWLEKHVGERIERPAHLPPRE